jgi:hypothetical protein
MNSDFETVEIGGKSFVRVPPNARRVANGMARLSYDFPEAIADLVDNSIAAHASRVEVVVESRIGGRVYVHVLDDGEGMARDDLPRAIKYGADDRDDPHSLGVYGFGLKTACQSFTDNFVVVSRKSGNDETWMITFDEELISRENDYLFELEIASARFKRELTQSIGENSGTLIVTENAHRFFRSERVSGDEAASKRYLNSQLKATVAHLRTAFQRFIDHNDARAANVAISVNGEQLTPWDPFCLKEPGVELAAEKVFTDLRTKSGKEGSVALRGYLLPAKVDFVDADYARDCDIGPNTHGVYVFRENRCIVQADYFNLFKRDTHMSNLRVEFSYDGTLDELFHTALQKKSIALNDLEDYVRDFLSPLIREANERSRGKQRKRDTKDIHKPSQKLIASAENRVAHAVIEPVDNKSATVQSKFGTVILPIPSVSDAEDVLPINPVDSINDGLLWQMKLHNNRQVVEINRGHDFYSRIYLPIKDNSTAVRGLDIVFWALAMAEANCAIPDYQRHFKEFRFEVSRTLRELVEQLPESVIDDDLDE